MLEKKEIQTGKKCAYTTVTHYKITKKMSLKIWISFYMYIYSIVLRSTRPNRSAVLSLDR